MGPPYLIRALRLFLIDSANKNVLRGVEEYSEEDLTFFLNLSAQSFAKSALVEKATCTVYFFIGFADVNAL